MKNSLPQEWGGASPLSAAGWWAAIDLFSGGDARLRAIRYADREYGEFEEPY
jgi:hypothetical protein